MMNVFLFGFKKCGKTYYGIKVAQALHMHFIDSDFLLEEVYLSHYHTPLSYREIVQKHGFLFFKNLEQHVVSLLVQKRNALVSLGGGVILNPENVTRLQQTGILIYLKPSKYTLKQHILSSDLPSYLDPKHPEESFEAFYTERSKIYESIPADVVHTENKTEEELIRELSTLIVTHQQKQKKNSLP